MGTKMKDPKRGLAIAMCAIHELKLHTCIFKCFGSTTPTDNNKHMKRTLFFSIFPGKCENESPFILSCSPHGSKGP